MIKPSYANGHKNQATRYFVNCECGTKILKSSICICGRTAGSIDETLEVASEEEKKESIDPDGRSERKSVC